MNRAAGQGENWCLETTEKTCVEPQAKFLPRVQEEWSCWKEAQNSPEVGFMTFKGWVKGSVLLTHKPAVKRRGPRHSGPQGCRLAARLCCPGDLILGTPVSTTAPREHRQLRGGREEPRRWQCVWKYFATHRLWNKTLCTKR